VSLIPRVRPEGHAFRKPATALFRITPVSVTTKANGGLLNSAKGVRDMMPNSSASSDTSSRKKFIQARPHSGNAVALPHA